MGNVIPWDRISKAIRLGQGEGEEGIVSMGNDVLAVTGYRGFFKGFKGIID